MPKYLFLLTISLYFSCAFGQENERILRKPKYISDYFTYTEQYKEFYISKNPITNIEYITYLGWIATAYKEYPKVLLQALPNNQPTNIDSIINIGFTPESLIKHIHSTPLLTDYMFNIKYLNFPVLGLSRKQAMDFLKWMSNRYNEYILVKEGIISFDPIQHRQNTFNIESYIFGHYHPINGPNAFFEENNEVRPVKWQDRILYPAFRLPSYFELNIYENELNTNLQAYKPNKFLKPWIDFYVEKQKEKFILKYEYGQSSSFTNCEFNLKSSVKIEKPRATSEIFLDKSTSMKQESIINQFISWDSILLNVNCENYITKPDSLGNMPFMIISEDINLEPTCMQTVDFIENHCMVDSISKEHKIFRYSISGVKSEN